MKEHENENTPATRFAPRIEDEDHELITDDGYIIREMP